jgi:hypothetical protein
MRKLILLFAGGAALTLFACLVAPDEPSGTASNALTCTSTERAFNGACRKVCAAAADCGSGTSCMKVSGNVALCLDYDHCAYLGSDTTCSGAAIGYSSYDPSSGDYGYGSYAFSPYGYGELGTYGYAGPGGCAGDATWQVIAPSGNPQCGASHSVTRCAPVGGHCALISGSTTDVADP